MKNAITMRVPEWKVKYTTPEEAGVYGAYHIEASLSKSGVFVLNPGESLELSAVFSGRKEGDEPFARINLDADRAGRRALIAQWWNNLVLDTPDKTLNTMFAFAMPKYESALSFFDR